MLKIQRKSSRARFPYSEFPLDVRERILCIYLKPITNVPLIIYTILRATEYTSPEDKKRISRVRFQRTGLVIQSLRRKLLRPQMEKCIESIAKKNMHFPRVARARMLYMQRSEKISRGAKIHNAVDLSRNVTLKEKNSISFEASFMQFCGIPIAIVCPIPDFVY